MKLCFPSLSLQGGDFSKGNGTTFSPAIFSFAEMQILCLSYTFMPTLNFFAGTGGESIYGGKFAGKVLYMKICLINHSSY